MKKARKFLQLTFVILPIFFTENLVKKTARCYEWTGLGIRKYAKDPEYGKSVFGVFLSRLAVY